VAKEKAWRKFMPDPSIDLCEEHLEEFFHMVFERQQIWWKKTKLKLPRPWTTDPILSEKPFTNVYRFLDRSSQYLIHNIIRDTSITKLEDLLWKMMLYRFYNKPETFTHSKYAVGLPSYKDFNPKVQWEQTVTHREKVGNSFHVAYLQNPTSLTKKKLGFDEKKERGNFKDFVYTHVVFKKAHSIIPELCRLFLSKALPDEIIKLYTTIDAVALFTATEFYLDLTYIPVYRDDFQFSWTPNHFANVGPGCSTGIEMIFPSLSKKDQWKALPLLRDLAEDELKKIGDFKYIRWDKSKEEYVRCGFNLDLHSGSEFALCEFQKYKKNQWGVGKQKTKYIPYEERKM
jgi:hypothetical protein